MGELENKSTDKLQDKIMRAEGLLAGVILQEPELLNDYTINKKILSADGMFYISIVDKLLQKGIEVVDEVSFKNEVDALGLTSTYKELGGWNTINDLMIADTKNIDSIFDDWTKWNLVKKYNEKGILDIEKHWNKLKDMKAQQVVDYIEYQISSVDIDICTDIEWENLNLTDEEIDNILSGINMGINYGKHSPLLNYLSSGLPLADLTMFSSYTNGGKSSFAMNNIIIPIAEQGIKTCIVANEQRSIVYKMLLQTYVLTERLDYWKLDRKKFKTGKWSDEDKKMVEKAREIIRKEYAPYITFVKLYDYDMQKVNKIAKKLAKTGLEVLLYDTFKFNGDDETVWKSLIEDSKQLFQICSKLGIAGVVTCQLAPGTKNRIRVIDEYCLSNAKQIAEVFSEMIAFRDVWEDEFDGEPYDIKPYRLKKDSSGKRTSEKEYFKLDKDKKYKIFFHFKTRNDSVGSAILYEFKGYQNKWIELGQCTVSHKNKF